MSCENPNQIVEFEDFQYSSYSPFSTLYPEEKQNREIEEETRIISCESDKFNKIILKDFTLNGNISEFSIRDVITKEKINYSLSGNFEGIVSKINDDNFSQNSIEITEETNLILNFDEEYNINDVSIYLYITDNRLNTDSFKMSFLKGKYAISEKVLVINTDFYSSFAGKYKMNVIHDSSWTNQTQFSEKYYRYRDKLFKCYDTERRYAEGYFTALEGYEKDENQSKKFYRYKLNNEVEIPVLSSQKPDILNKKIEIKDSKKKKSISTSSNEKKETIQINSQPEKITVVVPKKDNSINRNPISNIKIVALGLILSFILVISKILYKKIKISRTI